MSKNAAGFILFLIGLGATYRVNLIGKIGISEIFVFLLAPIVYLQDLNSLRRDGFSRVILLIFLALAGCVLAGFVNHTPIPFLLRGIASPYALFAGVVVIHHLLRRDFSNIKWLAMGFGISLLVSYTLHGGSFELEVNRDFTTSGAIMRMYILTPLMLCPIAGWYLKIPLLYSTLAPILLGLFFIATSASGRSTALITMSAGLLAYVGHKKLSGMRIISKHFVLAILSVIVCAFLFKTGYSHCAKKGVLGEAVRRKYLHQTRRGTGFLDLLIGGRSEFFAGLTAAVDSPILGYGPWALDVKGYGEEFVYKYGTDEEIRSLERSKLAGGSGLGLVPTHSHIVQFWVYYGIFGLIFWLYILRLMYVVFRRHIGVVPVFYGYLCVWAPPFAWSIFFSPFTERMQCSALIVVMLLTINVGRGKIAYWPKGSLKV